ncbi:hypothetical protein [Parasitella parasitica]|uniref:Uncharacterized protein n=1 Tax=Parasitella parasitica TaxID=35722 RepID=A0A0B7NN38_9FUNG|nr:hypothetical protein [Parasitella parasitica]
MTTKNLLKHQEVKDIVTKAVSGVDGNAYIIGDSEWADGTKSDVYPSTLPCAMDVHCDLWARQCHIINHASAKKWIGSALHPFTALSLLSVDQETCLLESEVWKDSTMTRLFEILHQILAKALDRETQMLDAVKSVCNTKIKVYQEILDTSGRLAYSSAIDLHAQQGIEKMRSVKRQFEEDDDQDTAAANSDTNSESSIRSFDEQKYQCTMEFTEQFKKTQKRMNWKACHALLLEKPDMIHYKNAESLRVRFEQYCDEYNYLVG